MTPPIAASPIRVAIIDDDSGLVTVLDRRFAALRWERQVLPYAVGADQLAAMRLHAVIVNPEITGLDYLERLAIALPGPALLVCTGTKLEQLSPGWRYLHTHFGVGYRFAARRAGVERGEPFGPAFQAPASAEPAEPAGAEPPAHHPAYA